jgi:catechol 2,3-dioxygenase-like lactoylglutathione lyase family enzyme
MSYVALVTDRFEEMTRFYGEGLGFPAVLSWDRANSQGCVFDLGGMRLEILDNQSEARPLRLEPPGERFHLVIEVADIDRFRDRLPPDTPVAVEVSWGARLFQVRDPDGVPVTVLQWL